MGLFQLLPDSTVEIPLSDYATLQQHHGPTTWIHAPQFTLLPLNVNRFGETPTDDKIKGGVPTFDVDPPTSCPDICTVSCICTVNTISDLYAAKT